MAKIILIFAFLLTFGFLNAQDSATVIVDFTTLTQIEYVTPLGGVTQENQTTYDDTLSKFVINFRQKFVMINTDYYEISEYAWSDVKKVYIILILYKEGRFTYVLYYPKSKMVCIKEDKEHTDTWWRNRHNKHK